MKCSSKPKVFLETNCPPVFFCVLLHLLLPSAFSSLTLPAVKNHPHSMMLPIGNDWMIYMTERKGPWPSNTHKRWSISPAVFFSSMYILVLISVRSFRAPSHIADLFEPHASSCILRSSGKRILFVLKTRGDKSPWCGMCWLRLYAVLIFLQNNRRLIYLSDFYLDFSSIIWLLVGFFFVLWCHIFTFAPFCFIYVFI